MSPKHEKDQARSQAVDSPAGPPNKARGKDKSEAYLDTGVRGRKKKASAIPIGSHIELGWDQYQWIVASKKKKGETHYYPTLERAFRGMLELMARDTQARTEAALLEHFLTVITEIHTMLRGMVCFDGPTSRLKLPAEFYQSPGEIRQAAVTEKV